MQRQRLKSGYRPTNETFEFTLRGGTNLPAYRVAVLDEGLSDAATTSVVPGATDTDGVLSISKYGTIIPVTAAGDAAADRQAAQQWTAVVTQEAINDDAKGEGLVEGRTKCLVTHAGAIAVGDPLTLNISAAGALTLNAGVATGQKTVAIAEEAIGDATSGAEIWVKFNGEGTGTGLDTSS